MKKLKSILIQSGGILVLSAVLGFTFNALSPQPLPLIREAVPIEERAEQWETLTAEEVLEHIDNGSALVIDARDPNEYEAGRILTALNLPESQFFEAFQEFGDSLPREIPLIVYCQGGECDQSHAVLERLNEVGFELLFLYPGGWNEWKEKGYASEP